MKREPAGEAWAVTYDGEWVAAWDDGGLDRTPDRHQRTLFGTRALAREALDEVRTDWPEARLVRVRFYKVTR